MNLKFPDDAQNATHAVLFVIYESAYNLTTRYSATNVFGKRKHAVLLATPNTHTEGNSFKYGTAQWGMLGDLFIGGGLGADVAFEHNAGDDQRSMAAGAGGGLNATGFYASLAANLAERTSSDIGNIIKSVGRTTTNVYQEKLFEAPGFRIFNFSFELFPRTPGEEQEMNQIIRVFRHSSAPGLTDDNIRFTFPYEYQIEFYNPTTGGFNRDIGIIGKSACTNVNVEYSTQGAHANLPSGSPSSAKITLTFEEMVLNHKENDVIGRQAPADTQSEDMF